MTRDSSMTPVEAAASIRDNLKNDPDLARAVRSMVERSEHADIYEWCGANPKQAVAIAEQLADIDGQINNMQARLDKGDLS